MCGIVGAVAQRDVAEILLEGLKRLEYRGYDSAGLALLSSEGTFNRLRRIGKVQELAEALQEHTLPRWYRYSTYAMGYSWRAERT